MTEALIFYPSAVMLLTVALISVFAKKVIYSLLAAICVFFLSGLIFYLLSAEYNAVVQLALYGLAVPILLAFALMFTNTRAEKNTLTFAPRRYIMFFAIGLILLALFYLLLISFHIYPVALFAAKQVNINSIKVFDALTSGFLNNYLIAFELISVLLFAVVVGVSDNAK